MTTSRSASKCHDESLSTRAHPRGRCSRGRCSSDIRAGPWKGCSLGHFGSQPCVGGLTWEALVRYQSCVEDMVIGVVTDKNADDYKLDIRSHRFYTRSHRRSYNRLHQPPQAV